MCALIYANYFRLSTKENLDEVLNVGDRLYKSVIDNLKCLGKFKHRLLCLDEIPDQVNILARYVNIEKAKIISGVTVSQADKSTLPSLHQSFQSVFCNNHYVLVLTGAVCSAVFVKDNKFWLFDSHSHEKHGLSSPNGKSVLLSFTVLDGLTRFMYAMYESMMIDLSCQFEILPLQFTSSSIENSSTTDLISKYFEDQKKRNQSIVSKKSMIQSDDNCFSTKATLKYFASNLRSKDRHEYFKRYKQMKRTDKEFKEKERKFQIASKRKARGDKEFKEKERKIQIILKKKKGVIKNSKKRNEKFRQLQREKKDMIKNSKKKKVKFKQPQREKQEVIKNLNKKRKFCKLYILEKQEVMRSLKLGGKRVKLHPKKKARNDRQYVIRELESKQKARQNVHYAKKK